MYKRSREEEDDDESVCQKQQTKEDSQVKLQVHKIREA